MKKQPALFISHGSPMMAVERSETSEFLQALGAALPEPEAIVVFSAHFDADKDIVITSGAHPGTIHDFYGFPDVLYQQQYPAPGAPDIAEKIAGIYREAGFSPVTDPVRGWDHGVWIPLKLMFPAANIPVVQISVNTRLGAAQNYQYGQLLSSLREEGIMIIGSGNMTHNLHEVFSPFPTPDRSHMMNAFTDWVHTQLVEQKNIEALINYCDEAPYVRFNHPTQEHFIPLLSVLGSSDMKHIKRLHDAVELDVLAMDAYIFS